MRALLLVFAWAVLAVPAAAAEVHGSTDLFKGTGVRMAWAILRGPDEARTMVVVRIRAPQVFALDVTGLDPFGGDRKVLAKPSPKDGRFEVRLPRAGFADLPKTEWRFAPGQGDRQATVVYHGIPDTTPEFADEARLDAYLDKRLAD